MNSDSHHDDQTERSPLVSIGLIVIVILLVPMFLYSTGPEGPIKEGDVIFSTGHHRVSFVHPAQFREQGYPAFCIIEPREQLIVTQRPATRTDRSLVVRPLAITKKDFPHCPPKADLILHAHQATLQADTWGGLRDTVANFFSVN